MPSRTQDVDPRPEGPRDHGAFVGITVCVSLMEGQWLDIEAGATRAATRRLPHLTGRSFDNP
jgi:hypothetical protein